MATAREIKRRIGSVKNIAQVTGALEAVSASKVRKSQERALGTRAYAAAAFQIMTHLGEQVGKGIQHPLLEPRRQVKELAVVLITSDRGLAGPYNSNIVRQAIDFERQRDLPTRYVTVGRKGRDLLVRRGSHIAAEFTGLPDTPDIAETTPVARVFMDDFLSGAVDEVHLAYTDFVNTLSQIPTIRRILPLQASETGLEQVEHAYEERPAGTRGSYIFEPGPEAILAEILPRFTELQLYQAILEAQASEHSARMVAMRNATENANALVDDLTLTYNKARQLSITSEMLDIVGGAEALAQERS
jgi:F-type H+-transporting ATPase subunit gamma